MELLEPVKQKFPMASYADLYTFAGAVAVEFMHGPRIKWFPGRTDATKGSDWKGPVRLPDADKGLLFLKKKS